MAQKIYKFFTLLFQLFCTMSVETRRYVIYLCFIMRDERYFTLYGTLLYCTKGFLIYFL
jgi:hypothetical protein